MVKMQETIEPEVDDTEKIIHEYRQEISRAIEKERTKMRELAEEQSNWIITKANEESAAIITQAQQEAKRIILEANEYANKDAGKIIIEAKQEAEQLIESTEKRLKKEGKEESKKEAERIIKEAKDEAAKLVTTARQVGEKTTKLIIAKTTKEAERIVSEAKAQTEIERDQLVANAISEIRSGSRLEAAQILAEASRKAEQIIVQAKSKIWTDLEKLVLLIKEVQQSLEKVFETTEGEITKLGPQSEETSESTNLEELERSRANNIEPEVRAVTIRNNELELSPASNIEPEASTVPVEKFDEKVYEGRLELNIVRPVDSSQMAVFEKLLLQVPNSRLIGRGGSIGEENWTEIELSEPLPMLSILKRMSPVKEVLAYGNNIVIALKDGQSVNNKN